MDTYISASRLKSCEHMILACTQRIKPYNGIAFTQSNNKLTETENNDAIPRRQVHDGLQFLLNLDEIWQKHHTYSGIHPENKFQRYLPLKLQLYVIFLNSPQISHFVCKYEYILIDAFNNEVLIITKTDILTVRGI